MARLFVSLDDEKARINFQLMQKVGPHGYVHGWKFVGIPNYDDLTEPASLGSFNYHAREGIGIEHPSLGMGIVTSVSPDRSRVKAVFAGRKEREFPSKNTGDDDPYFNEPDFSGTESNESHVNTSKPFTPFEKLKAAQRKAINAYVKPKTIIDSQLRSGVITANDPTVKTLDSLISDHALTEDTVLYRGVALTPELRESMKPGHNFTDRAYTSTSSQPAVAVDFAEGRATGNSIWVHHASHIKGSVPAVMRIHAPAGTHVGQGQDDLGEYILPRNTTLTVNGVSEDGRVFDVTANESVTPVSKSGRRHQITDGSSRFVHESNHGEWRLPAGH